MGQLFVAPNGRGVSRCVFFAKQGRFFCNSPLNRPNKSASTVSTVPQYLVCNSGSSVSSTVMKRRNSFGLRSNSLKPCSEVVSRLCLFVKSFVQGMSLLRCSTVLAQSAVCQANTRSCIFAILSSVVAVHLGVAHQNPTCNQVETRQTKEKSHRSQHPIALYFAA